MERSEYKILQMKPMELADIAATETKWEGAADPDAFIAEYSSLFQWAKSNTSANDGAPHQTRVYGLFDGDNKFSEALVEVVSTESRELVRGQTKLLTIQVSPEYWPGANKYSQLVLVFFSAIHGIIDISTEEGAKAIKIYGRSGELLDLLYGVEQAIQEKTKGLGVKCYIKGRWLCIEV